MVYGIESKFREFKFRDLKFIINFCVFLFVKLLVDFKYFYCMKIKEENCYDFLLIIIKLRFICRGLVKRCKIE